VGPSIFKKGYLHFYFNPDEPIQDNLPLEADEEEVHKDNIDDLEA